MVDQFAAINAFDKTRLRGVGVGRIRLSVGGIVQGHRLPVLPRSGEPHATRDPGGMLGSCMRGRQAVER
jgi:hypothetical protein